MNDQLASTLGDFAVFGVTRNSDLLGHTLPDCLGIAPRTIEFGAAGTFFFHSTYGDIAETPETIVLTLGSVRTPGMSALTAQQLLQEKAITSEAVKPQAFRGNTLVAGFSKQEPRFLAYKSILSTPQLYYSTSEDGILCATALRPLSMMLDRVEQAEDGIVAQFLFGAVHGPATHFRNVRRLISGERLAWRVGKLDVGIAQDLRFDQDGLRFERADSRALDAFYSCFRSLIGSYLDAVDGSGNGYANLLSGGVDSSLLQLAINENRPGAAARSFSFAVRVPSFETEIANAGRAAAIFGTQHTYVDITEKEFPNLLIRTTQTLAQPVLTSAEVCKLGLAEALSRTTDAPRFVFAAQGADTLFGLQVARKTSILDGLKNIPASTAALTLAGALLKPFSRRGQTLLNLADILSQLHDPDHFAAPLNTEASIVDFTQARRWFGDDAIRRALADRRAKEAAYLDSRNYTEKVHIMELFGDCDQIIVQSGQLFLAHRREQLYPFLDEDGIRLSLAFPPNVRYVRGTRHKYVLKQVLEQRVASAITRQPKGGSMFHADLQRWMKSGSLRDMIQAIDLPAFLGRAEFEQLVERSRLPQSLVLWHLLALDVFKKHVVNSGAAHRK